MVKFHEIINDLLLEERKVPEGKKYLVLFDIDETLLSPENIHIWKKSKDGKETPLTPQEYAKENTVEEKKNGVSYDYREFRDPEQVRKSILTGKPLWRNVRMMNDHISAGWNVGILTARGLEDVIWHSVSQWLMFRKEGPELEKLGRTLARNLVHAVSDEVKVYQGMTDFDKKANVIKKYAETYDRVKFVDDTPSNIEAVKKLNLPNVISVLAWKG